MNDKFYDQKKEKQDIMINGAMQIFAQYGYRHASVDDMVKVSGVSKGLWFHYFESKKGLYSFIVSYGIKYVLLEYGIKLEDKLTDMYELILDIEAVKISLMDMYPYLPLLVITLLEEEDEEALGIIDEVKKSYEDATENIFMNSDRTLFKAEVDSFMVCKMIDATFTKMMKAYYKAPIFMKNEYLTECEKYVQMMRSITYKL